MTESDIIWRRKMEKEKDMRHLLNPLDFSVEEIDQLLNLASDI